jgi:hypothetical protein
MRFDELSVGDLFVQIGPDLSLVWRKTGPATAEAVKGVDPERKIISRDERRVPLAATVQRIDPLSIIGKPAR